MKPPDVLLQGPSGFVKSLGGGKIGGYGVLFTSVNDPDREDEFFHQGTDFDLDDRGSLPIFWHHGLDPTIKRRKLSRGIPLIDGKGVFVETTLTRTDDVSEKILDMAEREQLAWSRGVERQSQH